MKENFKRCGLNKYKCIYCNKSILKMDLKEHFENKYYLEYINI